MVCSPRRRRCGGSWFADATSPEWTLRIDYSAVAPLLHLALTYLLGLPTHTAEKNTIKYCKYIHFIHSYATLNFNLKPNTTYIHQSLPDKYENILTKYDDYDYSVSDQFMQGEGSVGHLLLESEKPNIGHFQPAGAISKVWIKKLTIIKWEIQHTNSKIGNPTSKL